MNRYMDVGFELQDYVEPGSGMMTDFAVFAHSSENVFLASLSLRKKSTDPGK